MIGRAFRIAAVAAVGIAAAAGVADAGGLKVLHAFKGAKDGGVPGSGLIADGQGNFFGTTRQGGKGECHDFFNNVVGCGTVFKVTPDGKKVTLYVFKGTKDGGVPVGHLALGPDGSLYGAAQMGGTLCPAQGSSGCGTVFKIRPDGTESTLHQFQGGTDGNTPMAGVTLDADGNIYGTTQQGGASGCQQGGCGTVFKLTPTGTETILHSFGDGADGQNPQGGLAFDSAGNLYGTTASGGTGCTFECGTLFKIKPNGVKVVIHNFGVDVEDGGYPMGGLVFDDKGTLWGTTLQGGDHVRGSLYAVTRDGRESVVWAFGAFQDGAFPSDGVIFDGAGNLYGTLPTDGSEGPGMIFKYSIAGRAESIVYAFPDLPAGREPSGLVAFDAKGSIYGTTGSGGGNHADDCDANGCGEVFRLPMK